MTKIRTYWQDLLEIRQKLNLTQRQFAALFGFPVATLRHWERGNRRPSGCALALLFVIRANPRVVIQAVRKARHDWPGCLPPIEPLRSYRAPPGSGARRQRSLAAKAIRDRRELAHRSPPKWPGALD